MPSADSDVSPVRREVPLHRIRILVLLFAVAAICLAAGVVMLRSAAPVSLPEDAAIVYTSPGPVTQDTLSGQLLPGPENNQEVLIVTKEKISRQLAGNLGTESVPTPPEVWAGLTEGFAGLPRSAQVPSCPECTEYTLVVTSPSQGALLVVYASLHSDDENNTRISVQHWINPAKDAVFFF